MARRGQQGVIRSRVAEVHGARGPRSLLRKLRLYPGAGGCWGCFQQSRKYPAVPSWEGPYGSGQMDGSCRAPHRTRRKIRAEPGSAPGDGTAAADSGGKPRRKGNWQGLSGD